MVGESISKIFAGKPGVRSHMAVGYMRELREGTAARLRPSLSPLLLAARPC